MTWQCTSALWPMGSWPTLTSARIWPATPCGKIVTAVTPTYPEWELAWWADKYILSSNKSVEFLWNHIAQFWSAFTGCSTQYKDAAQRVIDAIDIIKRFTAKHSSDFEFVTTAQGTLSTKRKCFSFNFFEAACVEIRNLGRVQQWQNR